MQINFYDVIPIYIQIADSIEEDILNGKLKTGESCYSQLTLAKELKINPATAAKGIRALVERGILIKVRGQSMIVSKDAISLIRNRKREETMSEMIRNLVLEANKLDLSEQEVLEMIREQFQK